MFAIHRHDLRKTPSAALDAAEMWAGHFAGGAGPEAPGSSGWALRLYDLAHFLFEMHENVSAQRLTDEQHERAVALVSRAASTLRRDFPGLALPARVDAALGGLCTLLDAAAGKPAVDDTPLRQCHSGASWLKHIAHNAYHDLLWSENEDDTGCGRRTRWQPTLVTLIGPGNEA